MTNLELVEWAADQLGYEHRPSRYKQYIIDNTKERRVVNGSDITKSIGRYRHRRSGMDKALEISAKMYLGQANGDYELAKTVLRRVRY